MSEENNDIVDAEALEKSRERLGKAAIVKAAESELKLRKLRAGALEKLRKHGATALGYQAGMQNTGQNVTAIGRSAGTQKTSATFIGYDASTGKHRFGFGKDRSYNVDDSALTLADFFSTLFFDFTRHEHGDSYASVTGEHGDDVLLRVLAARLHEYVRRTYAAHGDNVLDRLAVDLVRVTGAATPVFMCGIDRRTVMSFDHERALRGEIKFDFDDFHSYELTPYFDDRMIVVALADVALGIDIGVRERINGVTVVVLLDGTGRAINPHRERAMYYQLADRFSAVGPSHYADAMFDAMIRRGENIGDNRVFLRDG